MTAQKVTISPSLQRFHNNIILWYSIKWLDSHDSCTYVHTAVRHTGLHFLISDVGRKNKGCRLDHERFLKDGSHSKGEITPWWALGRSPWNQCHLVRICAPRVAFCWSRTITILILTDNTMCQFEIWVCSPYPVVRCGFTMTPKQPWDPVKLRAACSAITTGYNALTHLTRGFSSYEMGTCGLRALMAVEMMVMSVEANTCECVSMLSTWACV